MLNNVVLVGRLVKEPTIQETENGYKKSYITLAVSRSYKNQDGEYETDFISILLWNKLAEHVCEYCKKGDVIGVKGIIETSRYEKDGETKYSTDIVAQKVTFLSSKKEPISEEE